ncbi:cytochrome P450 [Rhodococcus sp. JVH1]|uniref:cytochrome P450 n=1 Tax=Rhodococcus sp. JVH1 TaxID=745408 RepID=UPI000271FE12|nr:cytochrome P450 [Rhodococcus sp. JVH1]EJI98223.1 cytochrome P450 family protein [Rhodococcus sp. JVH1]
MTTQPDQQQRSAVDFNHHFLADGNAPEDAYRELRNSCPVAWSEEHGGYWIVTKHEHVSKVFQDYKSFTTARNPETPDLTNLSIPPSPFKIQVPEELDPPDFLPYRRLLNGVLSLQKVQEGPLSARARYWVDWHLDQVIETGECDLVYDLASPVIGAVVLEWLGFPSEDWRRISESFHDAVGYPPESERAQKAFADIAVFQARRITEEIAIRRRELAEGTPREDAMSYLVAQKIDGEPMTAEMAEAMVRLLIAGGVDTTASGSTSTLVHLHQHPDHREELRQNPELWGTAVDEFLRRYPPVLGHGRTVAQDVEVGGCPMKAGDRVLVSEASACWDEDEFPNADTVVLDRFPNRHVAFGLGIHRCPGMHLARYVLQHLVGQVLVRMPDYLVDETAAHRNANQAGMAGWASVRATFTPGERIVTRPDERTYGDRVEVTA